jgi:integrase
MTFLRLAYKRRHSDIGYVIHDKGKPVLDIGGAWNGKPDSFVQGSFGRACKRAGIVGVTPHTLGIPAERGWQWQGVPLRDIGAILGHSDERTTQALRAPSS